MKNLTQKQRKDLEKILSDLKTAKKYLLKDETLVCRKTRGAPYGTDYVNKTGEGIGSMNKQIGTDLCYLYNSIDALENMLNPVEVPIELI